MSYVDCTVKDKKGRKHCSFNDQNAKIISEGPETFNSDTFPAKINSHRTRRDAPERQKNIKNDFTHINMVPSFKGQYGSVTDNDYNSTLEFHTGNFLNREFQKREIEPHFTPYKTNVPNINYTYDGTRGEDDQNLTERLNIHKYKQGVRPDWAWTQVGPGVNKGYTNCGSEGYHPFWRPPVPTYEELKNKTRPEFDFRNHVIYGRMENFANSTTETMDWTREKNPTVWEDNRDKIHTPNVTSRSTRGRSEIIMNTNRKLTPSERYGQSRGPDREVSRDAEGHEVRHRSNNLNNVGVLNPDGPSQQQHYSQQDLNRQLVENLRRNNVGQLPLGSVDRAAGTIGALEHGIAEFTKDETVKRRNFFLMNSLRTGNVNVVDPDGGNNNYILPVGMAPDTKKQDIISQLKRGGVIDTMSANDYLDPQTPRETIKEQYVNKSYTRNIDSQGTSIHDLPDAPQSTIKQYYSERPTVQGQIGSRQTSVQKHPNAPQSTIKQYYAEQEGPNGNIGTQSTSVYNLPRAPDSTRKQEYIWDGVASSYATGHTAPTITKIRAPDPTRKDQVANVDGYIRHGGASEAPQMHPTIQIYSDRAMEARQGNSRIEQQLPGRLDPRSDRSGHSSQSYNQNNVTRQNYVAQPSDPSLMRVMPTNTLDMSKKTPSANSRFSW